MEKGQGITWNELANVYDKHHSGRKARTLPMDTVLDWALARKDLFYVDAEGSICRCEDKNS